MTLYVSISSSTHLPVCRHPRAAMLPEGQISTLLPSTFPPLLWQCEDQPGCLKYLFGDCPFSLSTLTSQKMGAAKDIFRLDSQGHLGTAGKKSWKIRRLRKCMCDSVPFSPLFSCSLSPPSGYAYYRIRPVAAPNSLTLHFSLLSLYQPIM